MKLSEEQWRFARDIAELLNFVHDMGFECTFGDVYRDARVHGHYGEKRSYSSAKSNHKLRLAVDLNLFIDGDYKADTEEYRILGNFWESLDKKNRWGGRFADGNHFERVAHGWR